ncbi:MAG: hypothetical protein K9N52_03495 [Verrucomicrobia bacterium]|nr:hypothetical protein [Verrucomicrobiota bacterium]
MSSNQRDLFEASSLTGFCKAQTVGNRVEPWHSRPLWLILRTQPCSVPK